MITRLKRTLPEEFLKNARMGISTQQERFSDEALIALHKKLPMLNLAPMPNYFSIDKVLNDWQEFETVEKAESYCGIKMMYIPDLIIRLKTGVLVKPYKIWGNKDDR